jgi:predicted dehydrogenase
MKILIAGYGSIGRRHYQNLRALGVDDVTFYRTGHSKLMTDEIEDAEIDYDLIHALHRKPDAVIVANPTSLHLETALAAAESGCHLLIEKPLSHSLSGVKEFAAAVNRHGSRVLMGYQFRFHPGIIAIKKAVIEGAIDCGRRPIGESTCPAGTHGRITGILTALRPHWGGECCSPYAIPSTIYAGSSVKLGPLRLQLAG